MTIRFTPQLIVLLLVFGLISAPCCGEEKPKYPDLKGSRSDSNGSVDWLSKGEEGAGAFTYSYEVWNRGKLNCRVGWDAVDLLSTILPEDSASGKVTGPTELRRVNGKLKYNGGTAAGDGVTEAPAWIANDGKPGRCAAEAKVTVERGKSLFPIEIKAESEAVFDEKSKTYKIKYAIQVTPVKPNADRSGTFVVSSDIIDFRNTVQINWQSIASPLWNRKSAATFEWGLIKDNGDLVFHKNDGDGQPLVVSAILSTGSAEPPKLMSKAAILSIFNENGTAVVAANAPLPGYAP